jgi:hypothetical protein
VFFKVCTFFFFIPGKKGQCNFSPIYYSTSMLLRFQIKKNVFHKPPHQLSSYRPISLLPIASKVFEKLLKCLLPLVEHANLIPNHQFGFRPRHLTIEQTYRLIRVLNDTLDNSQYCSAAFLDISQAFDKVWHKGLLYKLR